MKIVLSFNDIFSAISCWIKSVVENRMTQFINVQTFKAVLLKLVKVKTVFVHKFMYQLFAKIKLLCCYWQ